jgi:hypothetical protein
MTGSTGMASPDQLSPVTARRVFLRHMTIAAILLVAIASSNVFTTITDQARDGIYLPLWAPVTWEFTSVLCLWLLIPAVSWWLKQFPMTGPDWPRSLPAHLLATLPFSLAHVAGMVAFRDLVYRLLGHRYGFGSWWAHWFYEYRKDFVAYWLILLALVAYHFYGLWSDSRSPAPSSPPESLAGEFPIERLVVRKLNREYILNISDIDRIEADGNSVMVYAQGVAYPRRESLLALERRLAGGTSCGCTARISSTSTGSGKSNPGTVAIIGSCCKMEAA